MKNKIVLLTVMIMLVSARGINGEWVDADGVGQESMNVSLKIGLNYFSGQPSFCLDNLNNAHITFTYMPSGYEYDEIYYVKKTLQMEYIY